MKKIFLLISVLTLSVNVFSSQELNRAKALNVNGDYQRASQFLYSLSKNAKYRKERPEIAYELAKSLEGMGLRQAAVFQLIRAVRFGKGKVLEKALGTLSRIAFEVGDDVGLNYALSKINVSRFPDSQRPVLYFRFGEAYLGVNRHKKAIMAFSKVPQNHYLYSKARYFMGLALAEKNAVRDSYRSFTQSANARSEEGVVDDQRVAALMGRARVLYQMKRWDDSLEAYRLIPRDSLYYHDMLFESAWAMLRGGKFRSALSNFQSLHSEYYEDYFYPEAALLRAIVYLYICRVDEVNKVLDFYEKTYGAQTKKLRRYLKMHKTPKEDVRQYLLLLEQIEVGKKDKKLFKIPYVILRHLNRSSKVKTRSEYYFNLMDEIAKIDAFPEWSRSQVGKYVRASIEKRRKSSLKRLGQAIRSELQRYYKELVAFGDQKELIKFELVSAEKEEARKKLEARDDFNDNFDEGRKNSRFSFTKNGYEYWPFQGEYWLDEIGNYHYLGVSRCE